MTDTYDPIEVETDRYWRIEALRLAVETVASVRASGRSIREGATYHLADQYVAYIKTGQHSPLED